jgi:hypothetical protein
MTGNYQIDFKMYIPHKTGGFVDFLDHDGNFGMGLYYADSIFFATGYDFVTNSPNIVGKALSYKIDDWNDVSIMFNAATNKTTWKVNNKMLFDGTVADNPGYAYLEFAAIDVFTNLNVSEFYIDDIVYRSLPNERPLAEFLKKSKTMDISPNPANERLTLSPDVNTTDAWQIKLLNNVGQVIATHKGVGASSIDIATQDFNSGIYIVEFQSDETRWTKKVVIQH